MKIDRTRIHNLENYVSAIPDDVSIRVVSDVTSRPQALLQVGFDEANDGERILPNIIGPVSRFNANGRYKPLRDQPKESRYIRTVSWRWRQWSGRDQYEEREEFRDQFRDCYPREFASPPSVEVEITTLAGKKLVITPEIAKIPSNHEMLKHTINLMLELFGECELISTSFEGFAPAAARRVNWRILPPGDYPWERLQPHLKQILARTSDNSQRVIMDRAETIRAHAPDQIYVGAGGFGDYLAYEFRKVGFVVLESIRKDNAIYVFGEDWQSVSQLTKAEVLSSNHHVARIVHASGWKKRLAELLNNPPTRAAVLPA